MAWMCRSTNAGRWIRDWFSVSVTAVSSAWFAGGCLDLDVERGQQPLLAG